MLQDLLSSMPYQVARLKREVADETRRCCIDADVWEDYSAFSAFVMGTESECSILVKASTPEYAVDLAIIELEKQRQEEYYASQSNPS